MFTTDALKLVPTTIYIMNGIIKYRKKKGFLTYMDEVFIESKVLNEVHAEVQSRFTGIDDLAHGWEHVERVYTLALAIAEQEGANRFIIGMAALMHDLG